MTTERKFKYRWERTWDDKPKDFSAYDGEINIGRVYYHSTGPASFWSWTMAIDHDPANIQNFSGSAETRDEACYSVEAAYERVK